MKAKEGIIDLLNKILTAHLTAINQYFLHAKMCENWGYDRLHHKVKERSFDEMKDADELIEHILYLEGVPNVQRLGTVHVGETVPEQFKTDLQAEKEMLTLLTDGVSPIAPRWAITRSAICWKIWPRMWINTIDWIETQMETIKQVGLENYLSEQIKKEGS